MKFGSLFSGIGGFDLGLERAGMECAWRVEYDEQAASVLRRHWPNVDLYKDVRDVGGVRAKVCAERAREAGEGGAASEGSERADGEGRQRPGGDSGNGDGSIAPRATLAPVDLICGGFPCQDLSVAGRRAGLDGDRSGLWYEFHRIVSELRPPWVLIENVPGLLSGCGCVMCRAAQRIVRVHRRARSRSRALKCDLCHALERLLASHTGRNMAIVLSGLEKLGYVGAWRVVDSQYLGVAQRRRRVFLLATRDPGAPGPAEVLAIPEGLSGHPAPSRTAGEDVAGTLGAGANRTGGDRFGHGDLDGHGAYPLAHTLRAEGFDASEDGTGRGTPIVAQSFNWQSGGDCRGLELNDIPSALHMGQTPAILPFDTTQITSKLNRNNPKPGDPCHPLIAHISARGGAQQDEFVGAQDVTGALAHSSNAHGGHHQPKTFQGAVPRRLTPKEAERLQGFPDGHTAWGIDENGERVEMADGPRYRMLGNAVTVNVAEWIGRRLMEAVAAEAEDETEAA